MEKKLIISIDGKEYPAMNISSFNIGHDENVEIVNGKAQLKTDENGYYHLGTLTGTVVPGFQCGEVVKGESLNDSVPIRLTPVGRIPPPNDSAFQAIIKNMEAEMFKACGIPKGAFPMDRMAIPTGAFYSKKKSLDRNKLIQVEFMMGLRIRNDTLTLKQFRRIK